MPDSFRYTAPDGNTYLMEPETFDKTWFNDGVENGTAPVNSDQWLNVATSEVGEDNQFSSYDMVLIGQPAEDNRKRGRTVEWSMAAHDTATQDTVSENQRFRVIGKKRHNHDGETIADYGPHKDLNQSTPSERVGVPLKARKPIRHGDEVTLQSRDPDNTHGVNRDASAFRIHGYIGSRVD